MEKINKRVWNILTEEEKTALTLSLSFDKSTWQAGEIMGKAHYKYLEIQQRAVKFFKMFTAYFELTGNKLIPDNANLPWDFKEFIISILEKRRTYRKTVKGIGTKSLLANRKSMVRVNTLKEYMAQLENSGREDLVALHDLILEFDRWNNFRVLPPEMQEPSAYKRRNKTRLLKHLRNMKSMDKILIDRLYKEFQQKDLKKPAYFLPLVSDNFEAGYDIIRIKKSNKVLEYISKYLHLYIFDDLDLADDYGHLVYMYLDKDNRDCKIGQSFWADFRKLIKKSKNYNLVNNIIPRRAHLESTFASIGKSKLGQVKRVNTSKKFWDI